MQYKSIAKTRLTNLLGGITRKLNREFKLEISFTTERAALFTTAEQNVKLVWVLCFLNEYNKYYSDTKIARHTNNHIHLVVITPGRVSHHKQDALWCILLRMA